MATVPRFSEAPVSGRTEQTVSDSTAGLFSRLLNDVTALLRNEAALAKAELMEAMVETRRGVGAVAVGGAAVFVGVLALAAAAILALSNVMQPWLAALIVGLVLGVIGWVMLSSAKKKLSLNAFGMPRTRDSLRKDATTATRRVYER
jgi:hypothetical protein